MRRFIFYFVVLLISVWIGLRIAQDPGYTLFAYHQWTVEMPLWFALVCGLVLFILFYILVSSWRRVRTMPKRWRVKSTQRHQQKLHTLTTEGIFALAKGEWVKARNRFLKAVTHTQHPTLPYLGAALAADQLDAARERDIYLHKASGTTPETKLVAGLLNARFQLKNQPAAAAAALKELYAKTPKQHHVLHLLAKTYVQLGDWRQVFALLPALRKYKKVPAQQYEQLETATYSGMLKDAATRGGIQGLLEFWRKIPKEIQNRSAIMSTYSKLLFELNAIDEAEKFLQKSSEQTWDAKLLHLYGSIPSKNPDKKLMIAEEWLEKRKDDPDLLFLLGKLCVENQLWGKARSYFDASIAIKPTAAAYLELGKLLERLDEDNSLVLDCYRKGLDLATAH